ncbi:unnamed protein product [Ilex paraguariensis]|uniref:J domain-containing protein n=1 Tax=Ilex paraguariensis TaxID=185542 RepID=A0ABC8UYB0_9AQUA
MERNCKWKWQLVELSEYLCFCAGFIAIEIEDEIDCTGSKSAEDMDIEVDHYAVLGLPSGEEGFKLSEKEISKAYRKLFDDLLRVKREKVQRQSQHDSKRRKMMSDLEERERAAFASDPTVKVRDEEERIARKLKEEIARICAMHANKAAFTKSTLKKETPLGGKESMDSGGSALDKEKMLKLEAFKLYFVDQQQWLPQSMPSTSFKIKDRHSC